jgi:O-antigen ligase
MWAAGIMLFDQLRKMRPISLYYPLVAQGAVFAAMSLINIWLRKKPVMVYQFLFGDVHAFAAYLILQTGLLAGLWRNKRKLFGLASAFALFPAYSLLLVASYSRSGLIAYFAIILLYIGILAARIHRHDWQKIAFAFVTLLVILAIAAAYGPSDLVARTNGLYQKLEPMTPVALKRELIPRLIDLKGLFLTRIHLITPADLYAVRVRNWAVPIAMIRDYPILGIGVGKFYQNSAEYASRAPPDLYWKYPENAHNYYLQIAAETGLVGFMLFVGFLVWLFWKHFRPADPIKLGCGIGLLGLMIFSVAQHPLLVDRVFFVFVTICAVLAGHEGNGQGANNERRD